VLGGADHWSERLFGEENAMTTWRARTTMMVRSVIAPGTLLALPMTALAGGPFDINSLPVDEENRFANVGVFIGAIIDDEGDPIEDLVHCSGVLIHERVFLTAGHCTGPVAFPLPPFIAQFVSLGVNVLDRSTWIRVSRIVTDPSIPPCPFPPGCDPTTEDVFHSGDPGVGDHGLVFLSQAVRHIAPAKLAHPGTLETVKAAQTPMTIVGYPLPTPLADESEWDGLRRYRPSSLDKVLNEDWATWSLPSNVCFGDSGGPIFVDDHPTGGTKHDKTHERLVANVSDGGIDCLSANTNARLDTKRVQKWIRETIKSVLGEDISED
jgi:hypothetical protein